MSHRPERLLIVLSDIEMGAGGVQDDFPQSLWLGELLASYNDTPYRDQQVDIVFNGDTFDLLKTSWNGQYPRHITAEIAAGKFERVAQAHPGFFAGIRAFLEHERAPRNVHFTVGNHDYELLFPEVQAAVRRHTGLGDQVHFPGFVTTFGDVRIEHGAQADTLFAMDPERPFTFLKDQPILDLPWAAVALLDVAMPLHPVLYALDRIKMRRRVFELLPEVRTLITDAYWSYWTRDFWRDLLQRGDPLKRVSWTMLREVMYRFHTFDPHVHMENRYQDLVTNDPRWRLICIGHQHEPGWWSHLDRKVLRTSCFRNEFLMDTTGRITYQMPKVYAEITLREGRAVRSQLVELEGPPVLDGYMPEMISEVLQHIRPLLPSEVERQRIADERAAQEAAEESGQGPPPR